MIQSTISFTGDTEKIPPKRVMIYIDGFNFYHNLQFFYPDRKRYQRLNYKKLVEQFLGEHEIIQGTYFFTAYYTENRENPRYQRHENLNKALIVHGVSIILGAFIEKNKTVYKRAILGVQPPERLPDIDYIDSIDYRTKEEKKTDVNLAVRIVEDAYEDRFDIAYIISCDTDIVPAINLVKQRFPEKELINLRIAHSIGRDIRRMCHRGVEVSRKHIENALMDETIQTKTCTISIPIEWSQSSAKLL